MNDEAIIKLIGNNTFDTARNVVYYLILTKELNQKIEDIHSIKSIPIENKRFAKFLFESLLDYPEDQFELLKRFFFNMDKGEMDPLKALGLALNDLDYGLR